MSTLSFDFLNLDQGGMPANTVDDDLGVLGPFTVDDSVAGTNDLALNDIVTITGMGAGFTVDIQASFQGITTDGDPFFQITALNPGNTLNLVSVSDFVVPSDTDLTGETYTFDSFGPLSVCFAAGTMIATPAGEEAVEALEIGDEILTADGRTVPVLWLGRQTMMPMFAGERAVPVRIKAGALGDGLPRQDLVLTKDHAVMLGGFAINAGALVNGTSIVFDPPASLPPRVTYYHIETQEHDVILAEGVEVETFVDYVSRQAFDNYDEYVALFGHERVVQEMPCARISSARMVPDAVKAMVSGETRAVA